MPTYEYECDKCRKQFTVHQTFAEHDENKPPKCPKCGSRNSRQVISPVLVKTSKKS
jgi:putative FmdB family regulatory protein